MPRPVLAPVMLLIAAAALTGAARAAPPAGAGEKAPDLEASYREALAHYRAGRFREALDVIQKATAPGRATPALRALAGWCHLRGGELPQAESEFRATLILDPGAVDPLVGLGYTLLRRGSARQAAAQFSAALRREAANLDALKGYGLALRDQGKAEEAAGIFRRALALSPGDPEATAFLGQVLAASGQVREWRPRPPVAATTPVRVIARAAERRIFIADGGRQRPLFVKGVNLGVALPGRFPAEFPEGRETYASWLEAVAGMGANAVRTYTLLPPAFYAALKAHNRGPGMGRLWLLQGVWTELPGGDDYDAATFLEGFRAEIRRVIDAVHGNLDLPARPGHASGAYRADVSEFTLAYILGREWEPHSVLAYDARAGAAAGTRSPGRGEDVRAADSPGQVGRGGDYVTVSGATPFESWLARQLDFAIAYETDSYRQQRPVSFVSWPTLDPLTHPTEATVAEEMEQRRRRGDLAGRPPVLEYDNDAVSVDATHLRPTAAARAGLFASYHAYPYYPDFMNHEPGYLRARDSRGPSNYIGYLRDLARHHADQPVLIAEFGVPSSRGVAHLQALGWHHGGHSERAQGEIDARLMQDIHEAGLAGGVLFALLDEWFKRNWLVLDFEVPAERKPLWLNVLDPEQNYGVLAARPGETGWRVVVDGRPGDWSGMRPIAVKAGKGPERPIDAFDEARTLRALWAASDEAYLYLRLDVERLDTDGDGEPDWGETAYLIGIDTYDTRRGDRRMPVAETLRSPAGLEFCVILDGSTSARLLVDPPYDIRTHHDRRPYGSVANDDGRFMEIQVETNRERLGRDGTLFPAQEHNRSPLLHGSVEPRDPDHDTLADWRAGVASNLIEIRLGWGLLNVTDPSSRRVLHDDPNDLRSVGSLTTPGFRFYVAAIKPEGAPGAATPIPGRVADRLPAGGADAAKDLPLYAWRGWDRPSYRIEKKEAWSILKQALAAIPQEAAP